MRRGSSINSSRKRSEQQPPPVDEEMYSVEEEQDQAEDDEAEEENNQAEAEEEEEQRPKLAEGFFEIEAVRGKRTRKGKRQYLIKWRGWPETANTWEPFDNLQSCSDIIQAFEQRSAKTSRKRKRKQNTTSQLPKKKQQPDTSTSPTTQPNHNTVSNLTHPPHHPLETGKPAETNDYMLPLDTNHHALQGNVDATLCHLTHNGYTDVDVALHNNHNQEADPDPGFCNLTGPMLPPNGLDTANISIQVPEAAASEKDEQSKAETSGRFIGAKRRKSGRVRRFKQDSVPPALDQTRPSVPDITNGPTPLIFETLPNDERQVDCLENPSAIIKIIKPVGYSTSLSNDVHDVSLIFRAMRSDGGETEVDNNFLKVHNPLLLISYYEQHLRYTPPPT